MAKPWLDTANTLLSFGSMIPGPQQPFLMAGAMGTGVAKGVVDKKEEEKKRLEYERLLREQANRGGTPYRGPEDFSMGPRNTGVGYEPGVKDIWGKGATEPTGLGSMGTSQSEFTGGLDYAAPVGEGLSFLQKQNLRGGDTFSGGGADTFVPETGLSELQKANKINKLTTGIGIGANLLSLGIESFRKPSEPLQAPQKLEVPVLEDRTVAYKTEREKAIDESARGFSKSATLRGENPLFAASAESTMRDRAGRGVATDVEKMRSEKERAEAGMGLQAEQFNIRGQSGVDQANWMARKEDALRSGEAISQSVGGILNLGGRYAQQQSANAWNVENQIADYDRMMTEPGSDIQAIKMAKKNFMRRNNIPGWENI